MKTNMPIEAFVLGVCVHSPNQWIRLFITPKQIELLKEATNIREDFEVMTDENGAHWAKIIVENETNACT